MQAEEEREGVDLSLGSSAKLRDHLIKVRKIFITGVVNEQMAKEVVQQLHILASINDDPIYVFVNSPGGHVESGDMIFDAIRFITPKVIMVGSGTVSSVGALIFAAADKENRYSLPNTRFLLHRSSDGMQGLTSNLEIYRNEIIRMKDRLNNIFAHATGQPVEKIEADTQRDFWMSAEEWMNAEEAVDYGLVNRIIVTEAEIMRSSA